MENVRLKFVMSGKILPIRILLRACFWGTCIKYKFVKFVATLAALVVCSNAAHAALTFQLRTGDGSTNTQSLIIDSNSCPSQGPTSMYVGGIITNTGTTVTNISASLTGLNANVFLAGGQPATQAIGTLGAGESVGIYWFTGYGCTENATATPTVVITSSLGSQSTPLTLTIREAISANAGGNVASATLGPGAVVGQAVYYDASYDFGGSDIGDEFFLQPAGGQSFNAACFRLAGSNITASNINGVPAGTANKLYFRQSSRQAGNGYFVSVRYTFQYLCANSSTVARPYAVQTSGNTNIKYTGNFDGTGSIAITYPGATNPFTITKTVSDDYSFATSNTLLTYTVTITNPSIYASTISQIVDILPAGVSFAAIDSGSTVTAANSSSIPASGATGTLTFQGKLGQSYAIPAGGSVILKYTANRPAAAGSFTNSAQAYFGSATTPIAQATFQQLAPVALSVTKVSSVISDNISAANPKAIPGATIQYVFVLTNPNPLAFDANSVLISDQTPPNMVFCLADIGLIGSGPLSFVDGTPSSALTYNFIALNNGTDSIDFSNDNGTSWNYAPVVDANQCDAAITNFRVRPSGAFAGNGQFLMYVRYRLN